MLSERAQRQVDRFLDAAEEAMARFDWSGVRENALAVLRLDPGNADAQTFLAAAERDAPQPSGTVGASAAPGPGREPAPPSPTSFCDGRYEVKGFLGEGGKKRVYLAHDVKLDRDVAFALIKTEGLDEEGQTRVRREAQAMGKLGDHPNIVPVYDIGETGVGDWGLGVGSTNSPTPSSQPLTPYLVSQLMPGGDVERLIAQAADHRVPLDVVLKVADQVCQALDYAHSKGIVHRDLKPGNVWLTHYPDPQSATPSPQPPPVAKLGDFGLALVLERSRLTQVGMMVGTVSYMPPEQAIGGEVTARSDLYSLGAMLYEMATGRPPFVGDESVAIITQHLNTPPVAPSWHAPDLPPGLETLILRLLEKDPAKRPASASEVRQALAGVDLSPQPPPRRGEGEPGAAGAPPSLQGKEAGGLGQSPVYARTFVGREQELRQLQQAFDAALSGQGSLAMVVGEPGIGKTSLCEQLATYVAVRGGRAFVGHCYEEGSLSLPYLPFVEAMRSYVLSREPDDLRKDLGSGAADVARLISEIRDRLNVELRPPGDPEDDRWRLLQAVSGFLRNASSVQPLLVVLEDLHDADRGTMDLLLHLARNLQGARLLIVGTYRDVEVDRSHPLSGALAELRRVGDYPRISLRGLTPDEVHRMINSIQGQDVRWSLAEAVHRQTEGNPLFIQEVLRYLVEEGIIRRQEGRWRRATDTPPEMAIPEGLRDVIGKRLSRLSPACNALLSVAGVVGREFAPETLQAVAGVEEESLLAGLEEARRVGVLEELVRPGTVRYRFAHAFFRQTLYEELIAPRRIRLHQQVARALEQQYGNRLEEHAAELAEHFAHSSDPADLTKAVAYGEMAARRAASVWAHGEAVRLLEQALQVQEVLDPGDQGKRCDLLLALAGVLGPAGEPGRVFGEVGEEAFRLAEALGDEGRTSQACMLAIEAMLRYGGGTILGTAVYRQWADRGDAHAPPESRERVYADLALSGLGGIGSDPGRDPRLAGRARELARRLGESQALFWAAQQMMRPGLAVSDALVALADEFTALPREGARTRNIGQVLRRAQLIYLGAGDRARAEAMWGEIEELATRTRDAEVILWPIEIEALRALLDGQLEAAVAAGARAGAQAEELGMAVRSRQTAEGLTWRPLRYLGRANEALARVSDLERLADLWASTPWFRFMEIALCLAHAGRVDQARSALACALEPGRWLEQEDSAHRIGQLLEVAVLVGDRDAAALLAPRLAGVVATRHLYYVNNVARQLGAAAVLLDDRDAARAHYGRSLEWATAIRFRPEVALTRLAIAELALGEAPAPTPTPPPILGEGQTAAAGSPLPKLGEGPGVRAEALAHLDFAIEEFRAMKMQPSLERALRHKGLLRA